MTTVRLDPRRLELIGIALIAVLILILLPLVLDIFRLNLVGKYLTYAFVAIGLVLCWGQTGILSLGQGLFFGLGDYCMAAFLKLEASSVAKTKIQSTPGIPDFMDWNQLTALPFFWVPFKWLPFALIAVIVVPTILAFILGAALFKRRVGGVYFAIITQALALVMTILIVGQQGYTGGINGITDLRTLLGWDIRTDCAKYPLLRLLRPGPWHDVPGALRACQQARPYPRRRPRQGGSRPFLRLRRGQLQDFRFLPGVRHGRRRRCDVHAASRLHVAVLRRHRAVHRHGHLLCGGRPELHRWRGRRNAPGELGQDHVLRAISGTLAVRDGRVVHRRCRFLPARDRRRGDRSDHSEARLLEERLKRGR
jgi:Branched-chain amino acid transport system / permease component